MSFGFAVGDFLAVSELAWNLYRYCYVVARGAPQEFQLLLQEITTLSQSINLLQEEAKDPESTLVRSGETRVKLVQALIGRVMVTLTELEKHATKYAKLGDAKGKRKQFWAKFKWSIDAPDLESLRTKLVYHNGIINLLLTSCGNSSLQRIESSNMRLERRLTEINNLFHKIDARSPPEAPSISMTGNAEFGTPLLNAVLMKNAESGKRRWASIGVDEWIQAGRWWLLKSQSASYIGGTSDRRLSQQGYADLIKASWILIDVIARHPQMSLLDSDVRYDAELLAEAIRNEVAHLAASGPGLAKFSFDDIQECDLGIWQTQAKGPALQPGKETAGGTGQLHQRSRSWETEDSKVLFQRFAHYQSSEFGTATPCVILFIAHKVDRAAQIVLRDQSWITLATFIVGTTQFRTGKIEHVVDIGDQRIEFASSQDANYTCTISDAIDEYVLHCNSSVKEFETLNALILLFAIKNQSKVLVERLLNDQQVLADELLLGDEQAIGTSISSSAAAVGDCSILQAAKQAGARFIRQDDAGNLEQGSRSIPLACWMVQEGYLTAAVRLLEAKGILVSETDAQRWGSLHEAARVGDTEVVRFIASQKGVHINSEDHEGHTAFELAACSGHAHVVVELLSRGADVHGRHKPYPSILQRVAGAGYVDVVNHMIKAGVDVHGSNPGNSNAALREASKEGHLATVEALLNAGANTNVRPLYWDCTILGEAANRGHRDVVKALLKAGADVNASSSETLGTALQHASEGGHLDVVEVLLNAGANANVSLYSSYPTALGGASGQGHRAVVEALLKAGADVNAQCGLTAGTALQYASGPGHLDVIELLLKAGADVNAPGGRYFGTALQQAANRGHRDVVEALLKAGADVNASSSETLGTALQHASEGGYLDVVEALLNAGANVNVSYRNSHSTALGLASRRGHGAVVEALLKAGADVNALCGESCGTALQHASRAGYRDVVKELLKNGANVNAPGGKRTGTALQEASGHGHQDVFQELLKAGADVNAPGGEYSSSALHRAIDKQDVMMLEMLLTAGADVNATNDTGYTALGRVAELGHVVLIQKLLMAGADFNAPSKKGDHRTLLSIYTKGKVGKLLHKAAAQDRKKNAA